MQRERERRGDLIQFCGRVLGEFSEVMDERDDDGMGIGEVAGAVRCAKFNQSALLTYQPPHPTNTKKRASHRKENYQSGPTESVICCCHRVELTDVSDGHRI